MNTTNPKGNNRYGRKGIERCVLCRKHRQKVRPNACNSLITFSVFL